MREGRRHTASVLGIAAIASATLFTAGVVIPEGQAQKEGSEIYFQKPTYVQKSENALMRGDAEEAKRILTRALEKGVGDRYRYTVHNNLCVAYYLLDRFEASARQCRQAIGAQSNRWKAYNNLGNALSELGRYEEAVEAYEKGLSLASKSTTLRENRRLAIQRMRREGDNHDSRLPVPDEEPDQLAGRIALRCDLARC